MDERVSADVHAQPVNAPLFCSATASHAAILQQIATPNSRMAKHFWVRRAANQNTVFRDSETVHMRSAA